MSFGGKNIRRVIPGDRMPRDAATLNALFEATQRAGQKDVIAAGQPIRDRQRFGRVLVRNSSDAARGRFDILGIEDVILEPAIVNPAPPPTYMQNTAFYEMPALDCVAPTAEHLGRFVVLDEPLAPGWLGEAAIDGVTYARVRIVSPHHRYADVDEDDPTRLKTGWGGTAELLYVQPEQTRTNPDVAVCVIRLAATAPQTFVGVVTGCGRTITGVTYIRVKPLSQSPHTIEPDAPELTAVWASYDPMTVIDSHVLVARVSPFLQEDGETLITAVAVPFIAVDPSLLDEPAADCIAAYVNPCVDPVTPTACELIVP